MWGWTLVTWETLSVRSSTITALSLSFSSIDIASLKLIHFNYLWPTTREHEFGIYDVRMCPVYSFKARLGTSVIHVRAHYPAYTPTLVGLLKLDCLEFQILSLSLWKKLFCLSPFSALIPNPLHQNLMLLYGFTEFNFRDCIGKFKLIFFV